MTVEIDEANFKEYFRDVRKNNPRPNDVMARYRAVGELLDGVEKRMILSQLLHAEVGTDMAIKMLRNGVGATDESSLTITRQILDDVIAGASDEEILEKPYRVVIEKFFYADPAHVPSDDLHWDVIKIIRSKIVDENGKEIVEDTAQTG